MQRYEAYKDSGVEWIGEIPAGWKTSKVRYLARCLNGDRGENYPSGEDMVDEGIAFVTTESIHGLRVDFRKVKRITKERYETLGGVKLAIGDIVYCLRGSVGLCSINFDEEAGTVASSLMVIRPIDCNASWLLYAQNSEIAKAQLNEVMNGTCAANLSAESVSRFILPLPPLPEQQFIADYLDAKTAEIDSIASQTERSIELLREYRKSVISEAVTKGLDPDAPMKDSGVEWIGEIPAGWSLVKLGVVATKIGSGKTPRGGANVYHDEGITFLRSQNIYDTGLRLDDVAYISEEVDEEMSATRVFKGDVLLNITGGSIGRCCTYDLEAHANVNQHVCIIRPSGKALPKWIRYFWNSNPGRTTVDIHQSGANREGLNFEQIASARIPLPSVNEQTKIVLYIDAKTAEIDSLIADKQRQVQLLREYRKSLISEAVTGKFKVPGLE